MIALVRIAIGGAFVLAGLSTAHAQQKPVTIPDNLPASQQQEGQQTLVQLRALDKITARITELQIPLNTPSRFGTLLITAKYCRSRPPEEQPETFAYLEIDDVKQDGSKNRAFEGWMIASNPALNALEHAVYDVWVLSCKIVEAEVDPKSVGKE